MQVIFLAIGSPPSLPPPEPHRGEHERDRLEFSYPIEDWVLVLDGDPGPGDEWPTYAAD